MYGLLAASALLLAALGQGARATLGFKEMLAERGYSNELTQGNIKRVKATDGVVRVLLSNDVWMTIEDADLAKEINDKGEANLANLNKVKRLVSRRPAADDMFRRQSAGCMLQCNGFDSNSPCDETSGCSCFYASGPHGIGGSYYCSPT